MRKQVQAFARYTVYLAIYISLPPNHDMNTANVLAQSELTTRHVL